MGKIHAINDLEVIPLDTSPTPSYNINPVMNKLLTKMSRKVYMADPTILPRVQKYLEENVNNTFVEINVMADDLKNKYSRDYGKRKKSAFRQMVKKAYAVVMQGYGTGNRESSSEDLSDESVGDDDQIHFGDSVMNTHILEMYGRNMVPKPAAMADTNELIDISSDDSNEPPTLKSSNGPSTSHHKLMEGHFLDSLLPTLRPSALLPTPRGPPLLNPDKFTVTELPIDILSTPSTERGKKRKTNEMKTPTATSFTPNAKKKKGSSNLVLEESKLTFKDVGGMNKVLEDVCKLLVHIKHPEVYRQIGISPPRGFLLHGPPGCGKTLLANAIAGELEVPLLKVSAPELVAGVSGESEERIRELFERAMVASPCILFIDEIDAITPNRQTAQKEMERRIVAQLLTCMDDLSKNESGDQVLVIGATNRPDSLDPALRRAGRFDREVCLGIPDAKSRLHILQVLTTKLKLDEGFDFEYLSKYTPGYVGADLMALTREAAMAAVNRVFTAMKEKLKLEKALAKQKALEASLTKPDKEIVIPVDIIESELDKSEADIIVDGDDSKPETNENCVVIDDDLKQSESEKSQISVIEIGPPALTPEVIELTPLEELISWLHNQAPLNQEQLINLFITMDDFGIALKCVQPSAKREGFATVPDVTWDDVGSLRDIREELQMAILAPVRHAEQFKALGLSSATGVLLCGPPGCGKTLLAKAIANEAGINFISVKGPELLNMYVGESERAVRTCFERARNSAPCVIFFDELDALCPKRSDSREGGATMRVVNQMLTEMDGVEGRKDVYLLAASNRPDIVDPAVLRPGRLDKILYVGLPSPTDRVDILNTITKNGTRPLLSADVDLETIGKSEQCDGYTGADLAALVREAGVQALREVMTQGDLDKPIIVTTEHFTKAVSKIRPSVSEKDQLHYKKIKKIYSAKQPDIEEMELS